MFYDAQCLTMAIVVDFSFSEKARLENRKKELDIVKLQSERMRLLEEKAELQAELRKKAQNNESPFYKVCKKPNKDLRIRKDYDKGVGYAFHLNQAELYPITRCINKTSKNSH